MKIFFKIFIALSLGLFSCNNSSSTKYANAPENGDLNNTFKDQTLVTELTPEQKIQQEKDNLISEGWIEQSIKTGHLPECYNFKPIYGKEDNYLKIYVGSGTDVAVKLMSIETNNCHRFIFINSGSTYFVRNIPEGKYYLKIAYGKDWLSKIQNGQCIGKFIRGPMYEKGEDIMDFNLQHTTNGYNIPVYELELDVVSTNEFNTFDSQNISESDFNQ